MSCSSSAASLSFGGSDPHKLPPSLQAIVDESATAAAFDAMCDGTYPSLHETCKGVWIGSQDAAGITNPKDDSASFRAAQLSVLRSSKIGVIICCSGSGVDEQSAPRFKDEGISYASASLKDGNPADIADSAVQIGPLLTEALPLVRAAAKRGEGVLIHCNSGIHRSVSIACALLMIEQNLTLEDAFKVVVKGRVVGRPIFWPYLSSPSFQELAATLRK